MSDDNGGSPGKPTIVDSGEVTRLLAAAREGDRSALDRLFDLVYTELRRLAHGRRNQWRGNETLGTTALVHEAYLKLAHRGDVPWRDRAQFYATASRAMRHILINYARDQLAEKRGGAMPALPLDEFRIPDDAAVEGLIAVDQALSRLAAMNARQERVVECRFFGGLGVTETAAALDISPATVKRDWAVASAWLRRHLGSDGTEPGHDA